MRLDALEQLFNIVIQAPNAICRSFMSLLSNQEHESTTSNTYLHHIKAFTRLDLPISIYILLLKKMEEPLHGSSFYSSTNIFVHKM